MRFPLCRKRKSKTQRAVRHAIAGLIIGGAVGSVVGRHLMEENDENDEEEKGE
ncbi:hypothetical protein HOD24_04045 [Candidatus Peregrinibacteria bacterium]|nr:hypothetical protein [Candidatus Peregrinibacteria bacterium]